MRVRRLYIDHFTDEMVSYVVDSMREMKEERTDEHDDGDAVVSFKPLKEEWTAISLVIILLLRGRVA